MSNRNFYMIHKKQQRQLQQQQQRQRPSNQKQCMAQSALVCIATKGVHTKQQHTQWNYLQNAITKFGLAIYSDEKKRVTYRTHRKCISCNVSGYLAYYWFRDLNRIHECTHTHKTVTHRFRKKREEKKNVSNSMQRQFSSIKQMLYD